MKRQRGFLLLEALVVLFLVAVLIAAVATSFTSAMQKKHEDNAEEAVQKLFAAEVTYASKFGGAYATGSNATYLSACNINPLVTDAQHACLVESTLTNGTSYAYNGYQFGIALPSEGSGFLVTANPMNAAAGRRVFCGGSGGTLPGGLVHGVVGWNTAVTSADACNTLPALTDTDQGPAGIQGVQGQQGVAGVGTPGANGSNGANAPPCQGVGGSGGSGGVASGGLGSSGGNPTMPCAGQGGSGGQAGYDGTTPTGSAAATAYGASTNTITPLWTCPNTSAGQPYCTSIHWASPSNPTIFNPVTLTNTGKYSFLVSVTVDFIGDEFVICNVVDSNNSILVTSAPATGSNSQGLHSVQWFITGVTTIPASTIASLSCYVDQSNGSPNTGSGSGTVLATLNGQSGVNSAAYPDANITSASMTAIQTQ